MKTYIFRNTKNGHSFRVEAANLPLASIAAYVIVGSYAVEFVAIL